MPQQDRRIDVVVDTCDCGGGYPCSHGPFITGYVLEEPRPDIATRAAQRGEEIPYYAYH